MALYSDCIYAPLSRHAGAVWQNLSPYATAMHYVCAWAAPHKDNRCAKKHSGRQVGGKMGVLYAASRFSLGRRLRPTVR
jgi:hypothetical protein